MTARARGAGRQGERAMSYSGVVACILAACHHVKGGWLSPFYLQTLLPEEPYYTSSLVILTKGADCD
jgi:hypothetical protein